MAWYNPLSWWDSSSPVEQANTVIPSVPEPASQDWISGLKDLAAKVGTIFDTGYDIYYSIQGRRDADEAIARETVGDGDREPLITVGHTVDLGAFYRENKTVVWVLVGGLLLFGTAIILSVRKK